MSFEFIRLNEVNILKKVCFLLIGLFCLVVLQASAEIKWDSKKFMALSEMKPGDRGTGYTVFSGTTVEEFEFEIVSIEYNLAPGWHVIWARGIGDNFEKTGVAGGMSGSPLMIDGRLIGAISLGYFSQREHSNIFGATPIELMIDVAQRGMRPNLSYRGGGLFNLGSDTAWQGLNILPQLSDKPITVENPVVRTPTMPPTGIKSLTLPIPVALPSVDPQVMGLLKPLFDKHNLMPIQGAGGGAPVTDAPIEAGQIVGLEFVRGDYSAFGYGTMTYIDGNQLLGFGHSMFDEGHVNLPMSGGYVHFILPSRSRSFKVASSTKPVGTLVQDRQPAIAGLIGGHPSFIPVKLEVETVDGKTHSKAYEVVRHKDISASFTMSAAANIIRGLELAFGDHTVDIDSRIVLQDHPNLISREIVRKNTYSSSFSPGSAVFQVLSPLRQLIGNPYTKVDVEGVTLNVKLEDKRKTAVIEGLRINKDRYRPGAEVEVLITLRPYLEEPILQVGRIKIPQDAPERLTTVLVTSARSYQTFRRQRAPLNYRPKNINQLISILQQGESNNDIVMELFVSERGMTVQGEEFSSLPLSAMSVMNTPTQIGESGSTLATVLRVKTLPTKYVISGSGFIRFFVDRNAP